jgi:hypothetical protein
MEALIKSTREEMKEMMQIVKNQTTTPTISTKMSDEEKKKKHDEKQKKYNKSPVCTHCGRKHPYKKEDECWELKKNKASHPNNWKPSKST